MIPSSPVIIHHIRFPRLRDWSYSNLRAPFSRIYWHDQPGSYVQQAGQPEIPLLPERFYIIPRGTSFSTRSEGPILHFHVAFHSTWNMSQGVFPVPIRAESRKILKQLLASGERDVESTELTFQGYRMVFQILDELDVSERHPHPDSVRLQFAFNHLLHHSRKGVTNEELARIAHMSVNHFIRTFRNAYGITPQQFLIVRRCENAAALLDLPRLSIEQVAERAGFYDRYHFTRVFKKYRGVTPAAYRKRRELRAAAEDGKQ